MNQPAGYTEQRTLHEIVETLPSRYYYDPEHFQKELEAFWYRGWLCAGDARDLRERGDFQLVNIGDQSIVVIRGESGDLNAFHNTCRHRGSVLCTEATGNFKNGHIVCPYHAWTYSLSGSLLKTPRRLETSGFANEQFSLYSVAVFEWAGYIFINLSSDSACAPDQALGNVPKVFENWRLNTCSVGYRMQLNLACNWKVFWENFSECYHCPSVHPELCRVVPLFGKSWTRPSDDPNWEGLAEGQVDARPKLAPGYKTWTIDGQTVLPHFLNLSEAERGASHTVGVSHPSFYLIAHLDYARIVYLKPTGPESTVLTVDWLLNPQSTNVTDAEMKKVTTLGRVVMQQDGHVCELNQKGLRSRAHSAGVLVPQEHFVKDFHDYIRDGLSAAAAGG